MVARLVHRYGVSDTAYPRARTGRLDDIRAGDTALLGLVTDAALKGDGGPVRAARALRDAAHLESPGELVAFRLNQAGIRPDLVDLGDLVLGEDRQATADASREIVHRGGRPVLLGGDMADALNCLTATSQARASTPASGALRALFVSPDLEGPLGAASLQGPAGCLALGVHDFVALNTLRRWNAAGGRLRCAFECTEADHAATTSWLAASPHRHLPTFVVLDMACIDIGHAAGATGDNVGGLEPREFLALVEAVADHAPLAGAAVVHLAPERDPRGHSERLAARALNMLLALRTSDGLRPDSPADPGPAASP